MHKINKKNLIFAAVSLVFLGLLVFGSYRAKNDPVTVVINDQGFFPDEVIIEPGATVTWINEGENPHWPASNFHPKHAFYPEPGGCIGSKFDACRGLLKGETYSFKFDKAGSWPVHDHLFPGLLMTVEVEGGKEEESDAQLSGTPLQNFRTSGYAKQLQIIREMSRTDPTKAWAFLKQAFIVDGQVVGNAHEFSHIIGNESYRQSGLSGIKICDDTFAFGCFHGVTEAMLLKEGTEKIKAIETECLKYFPPEKTMDYTGCIHGTGHGVYTWEKGNLKQSLLDCDLISPDYRQYCYDGVFMENSSHPGSVFDPTNPWRLCSDLDVRYHRNCARYQSQIFLQNAKGQNPVGQVGENCTKGISAVLLETCFESLGYYVAQNSLGNPEVALEKCSGIHTREGVDICLYGAATETIFQRYGEYEKSAKLLCSKIEGGRNSACFLNVERMLK